MKKRKIAEKRKYLEHIVKKRDCWTERSRNRDIMIKRERKRRSDSD